MIIAGIILCVLAVVIPLPSILLWLGILLVVAGILLNVIPVGGSRRRWY